MTIDTAELKRRAEKARFEQNEAKKANARGVYALDRLIEAIDEGCECPDEGEPHEHPDPQPDPDPVPEPEPDPAPQPEPEPTPAPKPTGSRLGTKEVYFDASPEIMRKYVEEVPPRAEKVPAGQTSNFRWRCSPTMQNGFIDPMVEPGRPSHHLHTFSGMFNITPDTTVEDLIADDGPNTWIVGPLTRSTIWNTAAIIKDRLKYHDLIELYYKQIYRENQKEHFPALPYDHDLKPLYDAANRLKATGLSWQEAAEEVFGSAEEAYHIAAGTEYGQMNVPNGIGIIGGHHMDGRLGNCSFDLTVPGASKVFEGRTIEDCLSQWAGDGDTPAGTKIKTWVGFGPCWSGDLSSPDFRTHLAGFTSGVRSGYRDRRTRASHPFEIISIEAFNHYSQREGELPLSQLRFVTDPEGEPAGSRFHLNFVPLHSNQFRQGFYEDVLRMERNVSTSGDTIMLGDRLRARNLDYVHDGNLPRRFDDIPPNPHANHRAH